jgi:hypothetical protein
MSPFLPPLFCLLFSGYELGQIGRNGHFTQTLVSSCSRKLAIGSGHRKCCAISPWHIYDFLDPSLQHFSLDSCPIYDISLGSTSNPLALHQTRLPRNQIHPIDVVIFSSHPPQSHRIAGQVERNPWRRVELLAPTLNSPLKHGRQNPSNFILLSSDTFVPLLRILYLI